LTDDETNPARIHPQELFQTAGGEYMISRNRGITGYAAQQNLAVVYTDMGELAKAEEQWRLVVKDQPSYRTGRQGLWEVLMRQGKHQDALALAQSLLKEPCLRSLGQELAEKTTAAKRQQQHRTTQDHANGADKNVSLSVLSV
jgi:hypothetical protein